MVKNLKITRQITETGQNQEIDRFPAFISFEISIFSFY